MDLFTKLDMYIDYNNSYSLNKALSTLQREFHLAVNSGNSTQAQVVIFATKKLYEKFTTMFSESEELKETMSYSQKTFAKTMRAFIAHLLKQVKSNFGEALDYEKEIEQTISE